MTLLRIEVEDVISKKGVPLKRKVAVMLCDQCGKERRDHRNVRANAGRPRHYCSPACHALAMKSGGVADQARTASCQEKYGYAYALARPENLAKATVAAQTITAKAKKNATRRKNLKRLSIQLKRGLVLCRSHGEIEFLDGLAALLSTSYRPQAYANHWFIDGYFPAYDAWVQFDGVYWHSKPWAIERDRLQDEWFAAQERRLLRVTDREWNDDRAATLERAARWMINTQ